MALSQLIVTSRYLKSGTQKSKNKRRNYTKYIATRETVEVRDQNIMDRNDNATKNQQELLRDLLSDFPEVKRYLEYEDYTANPTVENASELISTIIERNADVIGNRQNFVGYMAMRPGVQKRGSHGLFNEKDEPIILDRVANEIANHKGNVWSHVVSLRREDAVRLGYDNSEVWRDLVKRHISDIAKAQRIPLCNLKWYAAFHDTTHHPHIHLLVYGANPKQGFLTREGIDKIRSVFANDIFHDDLQSIYQEQTLSRDELKAVSKTEFQSIVKKVQQGDFENPQLENLIRKLYLQLQSVKGKKVYGYLPPDVKETVNSIFSELAKDNNIRQLYEKWCSLERLKYKTYTQKEKELPPLVDNKVFQPVRNMIIRTVLDMNDTVVDAEMEEPEPTKQSEDNSDSSTVEIPPQMDKAIDYFKLSAEMNNKNGLYEYGKVLLLGEHIPKDNMKAIKLLEKAIKLENINAKRFLALEYLSGEHLEQDIEKGLVMLTECADSGDTSACYKLGKIYFKGEIVLQDLEKAEKYLLSAEDNEFTQYALGKLYLQEEKCDIQKAVDYFEKSAAKNMWSSYQLGRLYLFGVEGLEKNKKKAAQWLTKSANDGNEYAQNMLDDIDDFESQTLKNTVLSLFVNLSRCIEDDYTQKYKSVRRTVDSRLRKMIRQKKQSLGIKDEQSQNYEQSY